jgi:DNA (cytosine-5)-methyltransferase 1
VTTSPAALRVGPFAGIDGIELALQQAGHEAVLLCESDQSAQRVLQERFADVPLEGDVREHRGLPEADLITAGFPCQDLSQAGLTAGIGGSRSGLVGEVLRRIDAADTGAT